MPESIHLGVICGLTPEFSGRSPTYSDVHFIPHGPTNELLAAIARVLHFNALLSPKSQDWQRK
jgi:hypothetical protein